MAKPSDLACNQWQLVTDVWDGNEFEIVPATVPRATAQRNYASEMGVAFNKVCVKTAYIRLWTRQDQWSEYGQDRWVDNYMDEHHIDIKWQKDRKGESDEFIYVDADSEEPVHLPEPPAIVPDDWEADEYDPAWEHVKKTHPDAIKMWVCELKEDA